MTHASLAAGLVLLTATAGPAPSPEPSPEPTPRPSRHPAPQLSELVIFQGRWRCEGVVPASPFAEARKVDTRLTIEQDMGGFWFSGRGVEVKTEENPRPVTRLLFWTFDPVLGKYAGGWLDSRGGWSTQTSEEGWKEDQLVFLGHVTLTGQKVMSRETYTKPVDGAFTRRYEILDFSTWILALDETCRRAG